MGRYEPLPTLREARQALRLSQDGFAERLAVHMQADLRINRAPTGNLIGMWERGETRPGRDYRQGLTSFTGLSELDLGLVRDPASAARQATSGKEGDTNRRDVLVASATTAAAALLGLPSVRDPGIDTPTPTPGTVAELARLTDLHREWLYEYGASAQLQHGIAALVNRASALVARARDATTRARLLDALADISGVAAYACRDLGWHPIAERHYLAGVQAAQAAGNRALSGHLIVRMAGHHVELRQPDQILTHLEAADSIGVFGHRQISNQRALAAWAHAMRGDHNAVHRLIAQAEEAFAGPSDAGTASWQSRHVHESELYSLTGAAAAALADLQPAHAHEAIERLTRALTLRGGSYSRNAIMDQISLSEAYLAVHELPTALLVARHAYQMSGNTSSHLVDSRLNGLAARLRPHQRRSDVADLVHLIQKDTSSR